MPQKNPPFSKPTPASPPDFQRRIRPALHRLHRQNPHRHVREASRNRIRNAGCLRRRPKQTKEIRPTFFTRNLLISFQQQLIISRNLKEVPVRLFQSHSDLPLRSLLHVLLYGVKNPSCIINSFLCWRFHALQRIRDSQLFPLKSTKRMVRKNFHAPAFPSV